MSQAVNTTQSPALAEIGLRVPAEALDILRILGRLTLPERVMVLEFVSGAHRFFPSGGVRVAQPEEAA